MNTEKELVQITSSEPAPNPLDLAFDTGIDQAVAIVENRKMAYLESPDFTQPEKIFLANILDKVINDIKGLKTN